MSVLAVMSVKGGVGKTTVCAGLASAAWAGDVPIAVVDCDPSGNVTWALGGGDSGEAVGGVAAALKGRDPGVAPVWDGSVDLVEPGALSGASERALSSGELRHFKSMIGELRRGHELVLVDCPAGTGPLTQTVLATVDAVLTVAEPSALGVMAAADTKNVVDRARTSNRKLRSLGLVVDRLPGRGREAAERFQEIAEAAGRSLWRPPIPARVVLAEAIADGSPIHSWGVRGAEIAGIFDSYFSRVRRMAKN